jgi:hypothetical protein
VAETGTRQEYCGEREKKNYSGPVQTYKDYESDTTKNIQELNSIFNTVAQEKNECSERMYK